MRALLNNRLAQVAAVAVVIGVWAFLTSGIHAVDTERFPGPVDVGHALRQLWIAPGYAGGTLLQHAAASVLIVTGSFVLAALIGVPLGIAMGVDRRIEAFVQPVFLVVRPIPPIAWIPLAVLWFGIGAPSKIFVVFVSAFVPALINAYTGVRNVNPTLVAAARVHGASRRTLLLDIIVPAALPMIFTGLRLAMQGSWTALVAAELVGAVLGLGHVLTTAAYDIYPGMIACGMLAVALLGAATMYALTAVERAALPWAR